MLSLHRVMLSLDKVMLSLHVVWRNVASWFIDECGPSLLQGPRTRPFKETREGPGGADCGPSQRNTNHAGWLQQGPGGPQRQDLCSTNIVSHTNGGWSLWCCAFELQLQLKKKSCSHLFVMSAGKKELLFALLTRFVVMLSTLSHIFLLFLPHVLSVSRLEGTEEKLRNRESRPEDLHIIAELREMVTEREALVKKLVVSRLPVVWSQITLIPQLTLQFDLQLTSQFQ